MSPQADWLSSKQEKQTNVGENTGEKEPYTLLLEL
jgi:hypothetical protein